MIYFFIEILRVNTIFLLINSHNGHLHLDLSFFLVKYTLDVTYEIIVTVYSSVPKYKITKPTVNPLKRVSLPSVT